MILRDKGSRKKDWSDMIILMSDETHGYLLSNRTLGDQKEDFFHYVCYKLQNRGRVLRAERIHVRQETLAEPVGK